MNSDRQAGEFVAVIRHMLVNVEGFRCGSEREPLDEGC